MYGVCASGFSVPPACIRTRAVVVAAAMDAGSPHMAVAGRLCSGRNPLPVDGTLSLEDSSAHTKDMNGGREK